MICTLGHVFITLHTVHIVHNHVDMETEDLKETITYENIAANTLYACTI